MLRKLLLLVSIFLGSSAALAGNWSPQTSITGYYIYDETVAYIRTANNQNPDSCMYSAYLMIDPAKPNFKYIWAQVIAAYTTGSTVSLRYEGCNSDGYPKVMAIAIPNVW